MVVETESRSVALFVVVCVSWLTSLEEVSGSLAPQTQIRPVLQISDTVTNNQTPRAGNFQFTPEKNFSIAPERSLDDGWKVCVEHLCKCKGVIADCSNHSGQLTYVPELPKHISVLYFENNSLSAITRDDFFENATRISSLCLGDNGLRYVKPGVLANMTRLNSVMLNRNCLTFDTIRPFLSIARLVKLDLRQQSPPLGPIPDDLFQTHPLPYLETLYLHSNNLRRLKLDVLTPLVRLREFGAAQSRVKNVKSAFLPSLEVVNLGANAIMKFPKTCGNEGQSLFPNLTHLSVENNLIRFIPSKVCLPKLQLLQLNGNIIKTLHTDTFHTNRFPSLREVYLQSMQADMRTIERYAFNNTALQKISLMYNNLGFSKDYVHPDCFSGCTVLGDLQLGHNFFSEVALEKFQRFFRGLPQLQRLFLGGSEINELSAQSFTGMTSLVYLSLYRNQLTSLPSGIFDGLINLKYLSLNYNELSVVPEDAFPPEVRERLRILDVSGNPFKCSCGLLWLRDWMVSSPSVFNTSYTTYSCSNVANTTVASFRMNKQACLWSDVVNRSLIAGISLVFSGAAIIIALYRYRWHIRLVLYEAFRGRTDIRRQRLQTGRFLYDVFVCYDAQDVVWVRTHLMPELEGRLGLQLCVHQRDFRPGKHIVDNIVHSVESSKKVMMLFSRHFCRSPWCQFELNLCLGHVVENDDALVVVCLDDVPSRDLTPAMMAVLKTTTYIQWGDESDARASFWGRLELALQEILEIRSA